MRPPLLQRYSDASTHPQSGGICGTERRLPNREVEREQTDVTLVAGGPGGWKRRTRWRGASSSAPPGVQRCAIWGLFLLDQLDSPASWVVPTTTSSASSMEGRRRIRISQLSLTAGRWGGGEGSCDMRCRKTSIVGSQYARWRNPPSLPRWQGLGMRAVTSPSHQYRAQPAVQGRLYSLRRQHLP